jgi:hypothetical protein
MEVARRCQCRVLKQARAPPLGNQNQQMAHLVTQPDCTRSSDPKQIRLFSIAMQLTVSISFSSACYRTLAAPKVLTRACS